MAVRTAGFVVCRGKLEHRESNTNVIVSQIERLTRPQPGGEPVPASRSAAPPVARETGREDPARDGDRAPAGPSAVGLSKRGFEGVREAAMTELAAALPAPHSFGRRGR